MPARRKHLPPRGNDASTAGTAGAYQACAAVECGHARIRHLTGGPCADVQVWYADDGQGGATRRTRPCPCRGFLTPASV